MPKCTHQAMHAVLLVWRQANPARSTNPDASDSTVEGSGTGLGVPEEGPYTPPVGSKLIVVLSEEEPLRMIAVNEVLIDTSLELTLVPPRSNAPLVLSMTNENAPGVV